jgi:hypothetical protein
MLLSLVSALSARAQTPRADFVNGEREYIQSEILDREQTLFVYLPPRYAEASATYPVIYVVDAPHISNSFYDIVGMHSYANAMPLSIIVGVRSPDREHDLNPDTGAEDFLRYLVDEAIPFVDEHYRTAPFRSVGGHSLGGGFALYAFYSEPETFGAVLAGSPYPLEYISDMLEDGRAVTDSRHYRFLYASIGTVEDINRDEYARFRGALDRLSSPRLDYETQVHQGENHISNVVISIQDGLERLYRDWAFVLPDRLNEPVDSLFAWHYEGLSAKFGYQVDVPEWEVLFPVMDRLAQRGDFENAVRLLKYDISLHPSSDQAYAFLGRAYLSMGNRDAAREHLEKALELNPDNAFARRVLSTLAN